MCCLNGKNSTLNPRRNVKRHRNAVLFQDQEKEESDAYRKEQGKAREDVVMQREGVLGERKVSYTHLQMHHGVSASSMNKH